MNNLTKEDLLIIATALITERKIHEGLNKRVTTREMAHQPSMYQQRLRHIAAIDIALAKVQAMEKNCRG